MPHKFFTLFTILLAGGAVAVGCDGGSGPSGGGPVIASDAGASSLGGSCASSTLRGAWDVAAFPLGTAALRFDADCTFAEGTSGDCPGRAVYDNVTAPSGSVTITCEPTGETRTCTYALTEGSPRRLTFGCDGENGEFIAL